MKVSSRKSIIFIAGILLLAMQITCLGFTSSSIGSPYFKKLSFGDADPGTIPWKVVWDNDGVAYIGRDKLWRWDGGHWSVHGPESLQILKGLEIGPNGKLWVGGYNSVGFFDLTTLNYTSVLDWIPRKFRTFGEVWEVHYDGDYLWIATTNRLLKLNDSEFFHWDFDGNDRVVFFFLKNGVFAHVPDGGIWRISGEEAKLVCSDDKLTKKAILHLEEINDSTLKAISGDQLFEIDLLSGKLKNTQKFNKYISGLSSITKLPSDGYTLGTLGRGFYHLTSEGRRLTNIGSSTELASLVVTYTASKANGEVWILHINGISVYSIGGNRANIFRDEGLFEGKISSLYLFNEQLLFGTVSGLKWIKDFVGGNFVIETLLDTEISKIESVNEDIYVDQYSSILRFSDFLFQPVFEFQKEIVSFDLTMEGLLHVSFHDGLVSYRVGKGNELTELNSYRSSIAIDELETDKHGVTWGWSVDTPLYEIEVKKKDEVHVLKHAEVAGIQLQEISSRIMMTEEGPVIVTDEGIIRRDQKSVEWIIDELGIGMEVPLAGEFKYIDSGYEGWLVYNEPSTGSNLLIRVEWRTDHDPEWQILPWLDMRELGKIYKIKYFEEPEPVLAIIGMKGLLLADPQLSESIPIPSRPVVSTARDRLPVRAAYKMQFYEQGMRLIFSSPGQELYGPARYQTRIVGLDNEWSKPDEFADKEIGQLLEGNYRFEVRAVDPFGRTSPVNGIDIEIFPPWYRTVWAYGSFFFGPLALFFVVGIGYLKYRIYRMRIRQGELENLVEERTSELKRANSVKDDFIANLSHEIRNPLNGVIGLIRQLREGVAPSGRNVVALRGAASYLQRTVEDVLDVSKLETGDILVYRRTFDLEELVAGVIQIYRDEANEKGLLIEYGISTVDDIQIVSDDGKLQQILGNLVNNAVKFTEAGKIEVQVGLIELETGHAVQFKVKDTGCGIMESEREKVFEKFYQSKSDKSSVSGTGLGLTLVKAFTDHLGGNLEMCSEVGSGTEFIVSVPVEIIGAQKTENVSNMVNNLGLSVLIVEDMEYNRLYLEDFLGKLGCTVTSVEDGLAGLQIAREKEFDVILLDWELPGMKGYEISKTLRGDPDFSEQTRIFAMTAYATPDVQEKCFEVGMNAFFSKPLELKELHRELVQRYIVGRGNLEEMDFDGGWEHHKMRWLKIFIEHVEEVREDFDNSDVEAVAKDAHKLLGHLRMIKTVEIGDGILDLMTAANAGDLNGAKIEWEQVSEMLPWFLKEYGLL